jgi:hypothetical protein
MTGPLPYDQLKSAQRTVLFALLKGEPFDNIADRVDITTRTLRRPG